MSEPQITVNVDWKIATEGREILNKPDTPGLNDFGRFDPPSQSDTLGPYPDLSPETSGDETNGAPGNPPTGQ